MEGEEEVRRGSHSGTPAHTSTAVTACEHSLKNHLVDLPKASDSIHSSASPVPIVLCPQSKKRGR